MRTKTNLTELADQLPPRRLGEVLRRARWNAGLSRDEVSVVTTGLVSARQLASFERGRRRPSLLQLELLDASYPVDLAGHLRTAGVIPVIDLGTGVLELGTHRVQLINTESRQVLSQYVDLISMVRGIRTGDLQFRVEDVEALGTSLGRSRRSIQGDLRSLLRGDLALEQHPAADEALVGDADARDDLPATRSTQLVPLDARSWSDVLIGATAGPTAIDRLRMVELDAVRDAIYEPVSLRDRLLTRNTRSDRDRALRIRQRELLGELGFATWASMLIAIARAEAIVPITDPQKMLALNPAPPAPAPAATHVETTRVDAAFRVDELLDA